MKRITFFAAFIVALFAFNTNSAKAQVSAHIGVNIGQPAYYEPSPRVVVVERPVVYHRPAYYAPVRRVYYDRPVVVRRGYYRPAPRRVVVINPGYGHGRGHWHGHGRGHGRW